MTDIVAAKQILDKATLGNEITKKEANVLISTKSVDLNTLLETANTITRRNFGHEIIKCAIYPGQKVGSCSNDCAFCSQSTHHKCNISRVEVKSLNREDIVNNAKELWQLGVTRYSLVTSGECLTETEFNTILHILESIKKETDISLCASLGSLTEDRALKLKNAGVSRYHHNIETSRSFFPNICSTHSYDDKINTIRIARQSGMEICSGGIIAMGETIEQRVEMAFELKEIDIDCVPINILNPIPGTKLENQKPLTTDEILRSIAMFRLILPTKALKFAGGREKALGGDEYLGYGAGINSMIVGNYMTTCGKSFEQEIQNLKKAGLA